VAAAAVLGLLVLLPVVVLPAPGARAGDAPGSSGWTWPFPGAPPVVRRFEPPPGPYAPGHRGVDLAATVGTAVRSAGDGVVSFAGSVGGRPVVAVAHDGGLRTTYEPVLAAVRRGDAVARGDPLGRLVAVGGHCLPATCLHWGLRRGAVYLDPLSLVRPVRVRLLPVWGGPGAGGQAPLGRAGALAGGRTGPGGTASTSGDDGASPAALADDGGKPDAGSSRRPAPAGGLALALVAGAAIGLSVTQSRAGSASASRS
jgi:hypothetical protein